jgi:hypothetical protein
MLRRKWGIVFTLRHRLYTAEIVERFIEPVRFWTRAGAADWARDERMAYFDEPKLRGLVDVTVAKVGPFDAASYLRQADNPALARQVAEQALAGDRS